MKKIMVRSTALVLSIVFVCISFCECNTNSEERKKQRKPSANTFYEYYILPQRCTLDQLKTSFDEYRQSI